LNNFFHFVAGVWLPWIALLGSYLAAQNGYYYLPGGILVQWGKVALSTTSETSYNMNFNVPFSAAPWSCHATVFTTGADYDSDTWMQIVGTPTAEQIIWFLQKSTSGAIAGFHWFAIGPGNPSEVTEQEPPEDPPDNPVPDPGGGSGEDTTGTGAGGYDRNDILHFHEV
jgi:hypothetical protein